VTLVGGTRDGPNRGDGPATRVAVVGPGAIGATVAAAVRRAGAELVLCGRTPHERIVVEREGGDSEIVPGPVLTDAADVPGPADVVLLAVKAHQTAAAAPFLRALCRSGTVVVVLQNGVEQRELVGPHAPGATVLPAVVWMPVEAVAPAHVRVRGDLRLTLPDEPAAHAIAELIDGVEPAHDFAALAWRKLAINAVAGLMVLTGRRAGMFRRPDVAALARDLASECLAVARAEGAELPDPVADELVAEFAAYPEDLGSSILFDREAGRPLEWDARNGVVARLGAKHGVPTPVSDVIVPLLAAASGP
jgi:2-dehydropantoate 2-reductase